MAGVMMPDDGLDTLRGFDAVYFGAVGWPCVPDHVSLWACGCESAPVKMLASPGCCPSSTR
jgi:isocitrate/isopropylmalate dehydrogenase